MIELDEDNYPTDECLEAITNMPYEQINGFLESLLDAELPYASIWEETIDDERVLHYATGGWSGNESIIAAMLENALLRLMNYYAWKRGGLHSFLIKPTTEKVK